MYLKVAGFAPLSLEACLDLLGQADGIDDAPRPDIVPEQESQFLQGGLAQKTQEPFSCPNSFGR